MHTRRKTQFGLGSGSHMQPLGPGCESFIGVYVLGARCRRSDDGACAFWKEDNPFLNLLFHGTSDLSDHALERPRCLGRGPNHAILPSPSLIFLENRRKQGILRA